MSFPLGIKRISLEKHNITMKNKILEAQYKENIQRSLEIAQRSAQYGAWLEINKKNTVMFSKLDYKTK